MHRLVTALAASFLAAGLASAQAPGAHDMSKMGAPMAGKLTAAEVKKVDAAGRRITLAHEPIENLGMSRMTMTFRVKEGVALDDVKEGAKVMFAAEKAGSAIVVTRIEPAK